jgi:membrane-associated phospholipid phosphatase
MNEKCSDRELRLLKQEQLLLATSTIQFALFGSLAWWVHGHPILSIDVAITRALQRNHSPSLRSAMLALSYVNEHTFLNVLAVPLAMSFWMRHFRLEAVMIVGATTVSNLFRVWFHRVVNRPRPSPDLVRVEQKSTGKSFPSGHVLASITFWGWLLALWPLFRKENRRWRKALRCIPALLIVLVGPSRIYLGDHWASDVLGGYLLGSSWLALLFGVYLAWRNNGRSTSFRSQCALGQVV